MNGHGNKFVYSQIDPANATPAHTVPFAYDTGLSAGDVHLWGDNWRDVYYSSPNQTSGYTGNMWTTGGVSNYEVQFPQGDQAARDANHYIGRNLILPTGKTVSTAGVLLPLVAKTGTYTLTANDNVVTGDATGAAFTITLPTAVGIAGRSYKVKRINSGANAVTVGTTSSQTIDGATTVILSAQWQSVQVYSDGANWLVI